MNRALRGDARPVADAKHHISHFWRSACGQSLYSWGPSYVSPLRACQVYCAIQATLNTFKFSLSQLAVMQQSTTVLEGTVEHLALHVQNLCHQCQQLRSVYEAENIRNVWVDGAVEYPQATAEKYKGMSFELRYPPCSRTGISS